MKTYMHIKKKKGHSTIPTANELLAKDGNEKIIANEDITIIRENDGTINIFFHLEGYVSPHQTICPETGERLENCADWIPIAKTMFEGDITVFSYCILSEIDAVVEQLGICAFPLLTIDSTGTEHNLF